MRTSEQGLNLIKKWEGLSLVSYLCPAAKWTIGYGTTDGVTPNLAISRQIAETLLKLDIEKFENSVNDLVKVNLTQNQFDALVSFTYNLGPTNLAKSTLLEKLNNKDYVGAANEFPRWVYANGKKLQGLTNRRAEERTLFLNGS